MHYAVAWAFAALARISIQHPIKTLALIALLVAGSLPGLWRLRLNTDGRALLSPKAPEVIFDNQIRAKFGIEDQIIVLIRSEKGVFEPGTLQLVRDLTAEFTKLPGINPEHVMSLATEPSFRLRPGTLIHENLLDPPLKTKVEIDRLRDDLRRIELYDSTV